MSKWMICPKADRCSGYICSNKHKVPHEFIDEELHDIGCQGFDHWCPACIEVKGDKPQKLLTKGMPFTIRI